MTPFKVGLDFVGIHLYLEVDMDMSLTWTEGLIYFVGIQFFLR